MPFPISMVPEVSDSEEQKFDAVDAEDGTMEEVFMAWRSILPRPGAGKPAPVAAPRPQRVRKRAFRGNTPTGKAAFAPLCDRK